MRRLIPNGVEFEWSLYRAARLLKVIDSDLPSTPRPEHGSELIQGFQDATPLEPVNERRIARSLIL